MRNRKLRWPGAAASGARTGDGRYPGRWLLIAVLAAALGLSGCGLGPGEERVGRAQLRITRDFGEQRLGSARDEGVRAGDTVMRFLQRQRRVQTRYGGRFVQGIDGLSGEGADGRRDWFYFVNGIEGEVGAADRPLSPGDIVQWDYRRWDAAMSVPAIVGAYPEPFVSGAQGKRLPTRVECESERSAACREVKRRLGDAGVAATGAPLGTAAGPGVLRVVVGRWLVARRLRTAEALERGPARSGVFARFAGGRSLELLDQSGRRARAAPAGSGLVAAVGGHGQRPVWVVTGVDARGVERAAAALEERTLRDAFAVAVTPTGPVRVPVGRTAG